MRRLLTYFLLMVAVATGADKLSAQAYAGMTGLVHVPSAEMDPAGEARIGIHFLNREFLPGDVFIYEGRRYHTFSHYLSLTPFRWIEIGYVCTFLRNREVKGSIGGYGAKDRYFTLKLNPLREGKWHPAIAVGGHDFLDSRATLSGEGGELYFGNFYVAATKHIDLLQHELGIHIAYRHYRREYNRCWNGVVGGLTYRPAFARCLRALAEYTGNEVNIGLDCLLWRHLFLQTSLQEGRYLSGGICFRMNLL